VLEFYVRSGLTREEFIQIEPYLIGTNAVGLVNVNTASEAVLRCIPGVARPTPVPHRLSPVQCRQTQHARLGHRSAEPGGCVGAAPWLIGRTYQFSADIAAVGRNGRGYRRMKLVIDTSNGTFTVRSVAILLN
jgi:hypothetical protein